MPFNAVQEVLKDDHVDLVRSVEEMKGFSKNVSHLQIEIIFIPHCTVENLTLNLHNERPPHGHNSVGEGSSAKSGCVYKGKSSSSYNNLIKYR